MRGHFTNNVVLSDNNPISIFYRVKRRIRILCEKNWPKLWLHRSLSNGLESAIQSDSVIKERLDIFSYNCPFSKVDIVKLLSTENIELLQKHADDILDHKFNLLGSGPVYLGKRICWHYDYVSGFIWKPSIYSDINTYSPEGTDIKRPWELSRCQHFISLGLAWIVSHDNKYIQEYISEIEDWIEQNPIGYGVNWACPMDVAIRSVNWVAGYALFYLEIKNGKYTKFRKKLTKALWKHARFIETHLEWNGPFSERRANHFLSNLVGLFTLGICFINTVSGKRWLKFSHKWLEKEIRRQVFYDGVHFECATSYHRLCLEMFLWCYYLGINNSIVFSKEYQMRLNKMQSFCRSYTRPDGLAPVIGDNDDGRLILSNLTHINDHRYLWRQSKKSLSRIDSILLMGNSKPKIRPISDFKVFSVAGFYFYRRFGTYLAVRAGRLAHIGDHAHCDQLSFEFSIGSTPVIVDRGSYVYTSDQKKRNLYRSTRAHNVLRINHKEQNRASGNVFGLMDDTQTTVLNANALELTAVHKGFKRLKRSNLTHKRRFKYLKIKNALEIQDIINGLDNGDQLEWYFHLSPGLETETIGQTVTITQNSEVKCKMNFQNSLQISVERFDNSPSYGILQRAYVLIFKCEVSNFFSPYKVTFKISWDD
jgi:hypothetical protein